MESLLLKGGISKMINKLKDVDMGNGLGREPNLEDVVKKVNEIVDTINEMNKMLKTTSITLDMDNLGDTRLKELTEELSKAKNVMFARV